MQLHREMQHRADARRAVAELARLRLRQLQHSANVFAAQRRAARRCTIGAVVQHADRREVAAARRSAPPTGLTKRAIAIGLSTPSDAACSRRAPTAPPSRTPTMPPAPATFSTTTRLLEPLPSCWRNEPRGRSRRCRRRVNGTISVIGLAAGQACAQARPGQAAASSERRRWQSSGHCGQQVGGAPQCVEFGAPLAPPALRASSRRSTRRRGRSACSARRSSSRKPKSRTIICQASVGVTLWNVGSSVFGCMRRPSRAHAADRMVERPALRRQRAQVVGVGRHHREDDAALGAAARELGHCRRTV